MTSAAWRVLLLAAVGLLAQGCVDWVPSRDPHDRVWMERMLEGRYGSWVETGEEQSGPRPTDDRVASSPVAARLTRYGLDVWTRKVRMFAGTWELLGGLVGRAELPSGPALELFMKQITRTHWPMQTVSREHDYSLDVFVVLRPAGERGRLVRQWHFPPNEIAVTVAPIDEEAHRTLPPELRSRIPAAKTMALQGFLGVDRAGRAAVVTITGLTRPFEERVDLTEALRRPP
jgi:hypothetical protein